MAACIGDGVAGPALAACARAPARASSARLGGAHLDSWMYSDGIRTVALWMWARRFPSFTARRSRGCVTVCRASFE